MMFDPALLSALHNADNFLLCAHINPDGDAIGSMLSTGRLLRKLGKTVTMVCPDPVPIQLNWLPDVDLILPVEAAESRRIDAALCVDVSEPKRMGSAWTFYERAPLRLVIDHHPAQADYAQYAHINTDAPAVGELIFALWGEMGVALDREAAAQLYAAISTDTGNFCFDNVRPSTFACMEKLMSLGLDLAQASRRLFLVKTPGSVAALGRALSSLRYHCGGLATSMCLTARDKAECRATDGDLHGMVNQGLNIEGVRMTFMADESPSGWKISLRALPGWDVAAIANQFGGGGHVLAAGCVIPGDYAQVERRLVEAMEKALRG